MASQWDFYWASVDGKDASVSVDLSLIEKAPLSDKPEFLRVDIPMRAPNEHGWPADERPVLNDIEDRLLARLVEAEGFLHVGRMFRDGTFSSYFYGPKPADELEEALALVLKSFPDYESRCSGWKDRDWENYLKFLYPNTMGLEFMRTRGQVDDLREAGVDLESPAEVHHVVVFPEATACRTFIEGIVREGFKVLSETPELEFTRSEPLRFGALLRTVEHLFLLAEQGGGEYGGWDVPAFEEKVEVWKQRQMDEALFRRLVENNYDFSLPHVLDHCWYTPSKAAAKALAAELKKRGYRIGRCALSEAEAKVSWVVEASKTSLLDLETVHAEVVNLLRLARAHGADYDGWGTEQV